MNASAPPYLAPSILSADFSRLGEEVRALTRAGAHYIHVDVMDGQFVPNITIGQDITAAIHRATHLPLDVHLMIERPEQHIPTFVQAGASIITVHAEACPHLHRSIQEIHEAGAKAGVALNPATPLSALNHVLEELDIILIMTVNPGFGGQKPIAAAIRKIAQTRQMIFDAKLRTPPLIEVDGGVKVANAHEFAAADIFVSGSGILLWPEQIEGQIKSDLAEDALSVSYSHAIEAMRRALTSLR